MHDRQQLLQILTSELAFLEQGGYRRGPRFPWRPNFVFEDSPTCINFNQEQGQRRPCTECPLIGFVPKDRREPQFPCRHIHLTEQGETVNTFYETGTEKELEVALGQWLRYTIRRLEGRGKARTWASRTSEE
jgi:hypothetical protein